MTNNTEKINLSDFSDYPKRSNLPPKHVRIHTDRRMVKSYCSRLKSYALYAKMKYGEINPRLDEDLPYDINHDLIVLADADFGIFYIDVTEYIRRYIGKRVCFRGYIFKKKPHMLLIGWSAMACCMEDITVFAFICDTAEAVNFKEQQWVRAAGLIKEEYFEKVNASVPIIDILWIAECPEPEEKIINTFHIFLPS